MRFFEGLGRTDYQDLLRSIGRQLDVAGARDLRLIETESGLTIQCRRVAALADGFATARYGDEELLPLLQETYQLRGQGAEELPVTSPLGIPYQQWLRAIGRVLDGTGQQNLRLIERPAGVLVQTTGGLLRRGYETRHLDTATLVELSERVTGDLQIGWPD